MTTVIQFPKTHPYKHEFKTMKALQWKGKEFVEVVEVPRPIVTEPLDAIIRVTSASVCGSDLHLYHNELPGMEREDILGHEFMGFVEEVGSHVENLSIGDRVVVSCVIACGNCEYCKKELFSCCDATNPSKEMEEMYGHRTAGLFGYSHLTGGYDGGQAEYVRVPFANMNCLKVPAHLPDEQVIGLSDAVCTGWHANEMGQVSKGQTVAIWGCGPIGLMAMMWAKFRRAARIIAIDCVPARLKFAKEKYGADIIDFTYDDVVQKLKEYTLTGPDVCIDAVGFRFPKSFFEKLQRKMMLETDATEVLSEAIMSVKKGSIISVVGDYVSKTNRFPIGAFMEKGLTMRAGQVHVQRYWKELLQYIEDGLVEPQAMFTHHIPLERANEAYELFDKKEDGCIKVLLHTSTAQQRPTAPIPQETVEKL